MRRRPVQSRAVRSVGYDPHSCVLEVEYENERVYQYAGVPQDAFTALTDGRSIGEYVNHEIKPRFPARAVARTG